MSKLMDVFEVGEEFATITYGGKLAVWRVDADGLPRNTHECDES